MVGMAERSSPFEHLGLEVAKDEGSGLPEKSVMEAAPDGRA
jgi:hypothetical protein